MISAAKIARTATPSAQAGGVVSSPGRRRFAIGVVAATLFLIFMGAQVKSHDAGLATSNWPTSWGEWWPAEVEGFVLVGGLDITHEHMHRAVASAVGLLAIVLAVWTARHDRRPLTRRLAWTLLGLIVFQGLLGGLTVVMRLPPLVSASHGTLAQTILCLAAWVAWLNTAEGAGAPRGEALPAARGHAEAAHRLGRLALLSVFVQLILGAWMRHVEAGLAVPFFPLSADGSLLPEHVDHLVIAHMFHRGFAFVTIALVFAAVLRAGQAVPRLMGHGALLAGAICVQGILGAGVIWSLRHPFVTSLHVTNGAVVLMLCWLLVLRLGRLTGQVAAPPLASGATA